MFKKVAGYDVYIEDGFILRGTKLDHNGGRVTAYVYRWSYKQNCWIKEDRITVAAFRSGVRRGTIELK